MKAQEIFVICPFSRPEFKINVIDNFSRQSFGNKHLIVVENGDGVGEFADRPWVVRLQSNTSSAAAKNVGLNYLKDNYDKAFFTIFDDDDYYDTDYLQELSDNSDKGDIIGKLNTFAKLSDGYIRFLDFGAENVETKNIWGATISAWSDISVPFSEDGYYAEDAKWILEMVKKGKRLYATSRHNFVISRGVHSHSWNISDDDFTSLAIITSSVDYDFIDGEFRARESQIVSYTPIKAPRLPRKIQKELGII
jgi:hypothetical protein